MLKSAISKWLWRASYLLVRVGWVTANYRIILWELVRGNSWRFQGGSSASRQLPGFEKAVKLRTHTSKMPLPNGNSLWRTWRVSGTLDRNGNQLGRKDWNITNWVTVSFSKISQKKRHNNTYHNANVAMTTTPSLMTFNIVDILRNIKDKSKRRNKGKIHYYKKAKMIKLQANIGFINCKPQFQIVSSCLQYGNRY